MRNSIPIWCCFLCLWLEAMSPAWPVEDWVGQEVWSTICTMSLKTQKQRHTLDICHSVTDISDRPGRMICPLCMSECSWALCRIRNQTPSCNLYPACCMYCMLVSSLLSVILHCPAAGWGLSFGELHPNYRGWNQAQHLGGLLLLMLQMWNIFCCYYCFRTLGVVNYRRLKAHMVEIIIAKFHGKMEMLLRFSMHNLPKHKISPVMGEELHELTVIGFQYKSNRWAVTELYFADFQFLSSSPFQSICSARHFFRRP